MTFRNLTALLVLALSACDGGDDPIQATLDPPQVAVLAQAGRTGEQTVTATATLSRAPPSSALVHVRVPEADLDPASVLVVAGVQRTQFTVSARVRSGLPVGTHQGSITLELGSDAPSPSRHSRIEGAFSYTVAVMEPTLLVTIERPPPIPPGNGLAGVDVRLERGGETITKQYDVAAP